VAELLESSGALRDMVPETTSPDAGRFNHDGAARPGFDPERSATKRPGAAAAGLANNTEPWKCCCCAWAVSAGGRPPATFKAYPRRAVREPEQHTGNLFVAMKAVHRQTERLAGACLLSAHGANACR